MSGRRYTVEDGRIILDAEEEERLWALGYDPLDAIVQYEQDEMDRLLRSADERATMCSPPDLA